MTIRLARPDVGPMEEQALVETLRSGQLVNGPRAVVFEQGLAALTGRRFAVCVSSGTSALVLAMKALGVGPGQVVVVPGLTFPAPAHAAALLGARVRLADVDPGTFNLSARTLLPCLGDDVSLVVAIDQFGLPAPSVEIEALLAPRGIPLLVDAACSIGSTLQDRPAGSFGRLATFSFHPRKILTTGEGGAILTDDEQLAAHLRRLRNHGLEAGVFTEAAGNLRLGELNAALGQVQLARLPQILAARRPLAERYRATLPLAVQRTPDGVSPNFQTLAASLPAADRTAADRDTLLAHLRAHDIEATIASYALARLPSLAPHLAPDQPPTPTCERIADLGLALPLHDGLTLDEVDEVVARVDEWCRKS